MPPLTVNFTNPLGEQINPTNTTYQSYSIPTTAYFFWPTQVITDTTTQFYVAGTTVLTSSAAATVLLPPVELVSAGSAFILANVGTYTLAIQGSDTSSIINITSGQRVLFNTTTNVVTSVESACWATTVLGATTNTNTLSQNLGNSLRFITTTNEVQVAQTVTSIQAALPGSANVYTLGIPQAITYCATTLINPPGINTQVNVQLGISAQLYGACGFTCTFVNEGNQPVVIQTQNNDTINGLPIQSSNDSASFVLIPSSSCNLTSTTNGDWLITAQSSPYQQIFRTASINLATANYVGLSNQSSQTVGIDNVTILPNPLDGASIAIDMSTNLDLIYSPLWIITGSPPTAIQEYYASIGQSSFWILLPNNFTSIYFVLAQSTTSAFKFGLGAEYVTGPTTYVVIPPLNDSYETNGNTTWPIQYSAAITNSPLTQFTSSLLFTGGGGSGTLYPDITDIDGTVYITGPGGLIVENGPLELSGSFRGTIGGNEIAVVIPEPYVLNDLVVVGTGGNTADSGIAVSTNQSLLPGTNYYVPTQEAVLQYISTVITSPLTFLGTWNATTNTPHLVAGTGVVGDTYITAVAGTQTAPSGTSTSYNVGDFLVYNQNAIWLKIPMTSFVISVNGLTGVVVLNLEDLNDVVITSPGDGDVLVYDSGSSEWVNAPYPPNMTLEDLVDVNVISPLNGQVLTYNSSVSEWENMTIPTGIYSDFNRVSEVATPYTILVSDSFNLLYMTGSGTYHIPSPSGFAIGFTVCISNSELTSGNGHMSISGPDGVVAITQTNTGIPAYYKFEVAYSSTLTSNIWVVNNIEYNEYSELVTEASLDGGTLPASFTTLDTSGVATLNSLVVDNAATFLNTAGGAKILMINDANTQPAAQFYIEGENTPYSGLGGAGNPAVLKAYGGAGQSSMSFSYNSTDGRPYLPEATVGTAGGPLAVACWGDLKFNTLLTGPTYVIYPSGACDIWGVALISNPSTSTTVTLPFEVLYASFLLTSNGQFDGASYSNLFVELIANQISETQFDIIMSAAPSASNTANISYFVRGQVPL